MAEQIDINSDTQAGLKAVDDLLEEVDPQFKEKLTQMNKEVDQSGLTEAFESISISPDYLQPDQGVPIAEAIKPTINEEKIDDSKFDQGQSFFILLSIWLWQTVVFFLRVTNTALRIPIVARKSSSKEALKEFVHEASGPFKKWFVYLQNVLDKLKSYKPIALIRLALIVALVISIKFVYKDMSHHLNPDSSKDPFLNSWSEEAGSVHEAPAEDSDEDIENPEKHPEYTVLIPRIVASLKAPSQKASPMIATELYIEASNQDCAIELHDRELEVRDTLNGIFLESTFDELDTPVGKEHLKAKIRTGLNHFLTKGHVKRVFFSTFNISP